MAIRIPISEARKRLSNLLKNISDHPEKVYEITVNNIVLGELRAAPSKGLRIGAGEALLNAMDQLENRKNKKANKTSTARNHNQYLYPPRKRIAANS
jgi:hypothetical protein